MFNYHNKLFLKCGVINNYIISILSNYLFKINSSELDFICLYYIVKLNCKSSTINFNLYKFSSCISFENIICHGIPVVKNYTYNYLKIDIAINYHNFHSDNCYVSNFYYKKKNFFFKNFFFNILNIIKTNIYYCFFKKIIKNIKNNFFINNDYCSHGIFKKLHNKIIIEHNEKNNNKKIKNFDSFTIEPMFIVKNISGYDYLKIFLTIKNNLTFQWEHTLYIMNKKIILTTLRKNEICYLVL
ncbi:hypothetical protein ACJEC8_00030 [Candidatus Carsonella ruddii]|uniref:hypothetical protein n=1 Tax=Carsonella ruddii TaxID=114186 RepID=UPI003D4EBB18